MEQEQYCYIFRNTLGRWVLGNLEQPELAWSGSQWMPHRHGLPAGKVQISNLGSREEAWLYAEDAGFVIAVSGYTADEECITCFRCGLTSYSLGDVEHKYCGNCHLFHESKTGL
jgi:hypothetical protein